MPLANLAIKCVLWLYTVGGKMKQELAIHTHILD